MQEKRSNITLNNIKRKRYIKQQRRRRMIFISLVSLTFICFLFKNFTYYAYEVDTNISSFENLTSAKPETPKIIEIPTPNEKNLSDVTATAPSDNDLIKGSNVTVLGDKYAIDANTVSDMLTGDYIGDEKYVFLTFDDGPSPNTEVVLDILKENDVKATFFVLGKNLAENNDSKELLKRTFNDGHAIANHSYSHDLNMLYPSNSVDSDYFISEFNKTNTLIKSILGDNFNTNVLRMPGGYQSREYYDDTNLPYFDSLLDNDNIVSIDWNALNGDAEGIDYSTDEMLEYAKSTTGTSNQVVILMHDTYGKEKTAEMLPELIQFYKDNGYEFKTIK